MRKSSRRGMRKRGELAKARKRLDREFLKGAANTVRNQILAILNERRGSATELAEDLGLDFAEVNYELKALLKAKLIKRAGERKRGNTTEVFYVATARAYIDPSEWPDVADPIQAGLRASLLQNIYVDAVTAVSEETYDSMEDEDGFASAHMSWTPMIVDRQGWNDLMALLLETVEEVIDIQQESGERLLAEQAEGVCCTVSMLGFASANPPKRVALPMDAEQLADLTAHMGRQVKESAGSAKRKKDGGKSSRAARSKSKRRR
jgi:DNA-binding transcriptional ArsR family regulator